MKKGVNQWLFPDSMSIERCMAVARDAGFNGIEVCMGENAPKKKAGSSRPDEDMGIEGYLSDLALNTSEDEMMAVARAAQKIGIEIYSISTALNFNYPLTSPDARVRAKGVKVIQKALKYGLLLGADVALVVPGVVTTEVTYSQALERSKAAILQLVPLAKETGVCMGIENVWNKFILSPLEFRDFIDSFKSEYIGALFDVANILAYGYPEQWIDELAGRIKSVHIKDFMTSVGNINGFVNIFEGDVDWPKVMKALRRVGYDGYLTVETIPAYRHCPESRVYESSIALDRMLNL
jgi:hexulose-6-phosphate isomerase